MNWRDRAGFCRTSRQGTRPAVATKSPPFVFPPRPLSALTWPRHSCQLTSLYSDPTFRLPAVTPPPCCLPTLLQIPTRFLSWGWKVSAAISGLSGRPYRLLHQYPPSGARPSWHMAWGRACRQSSLAKRVISGLFVCRVC